MSIISKLTKKRTGITVREETTLPQILYWIFLLMVLTSIFLKSFLNVSGYVTIGWIVCLVAYILSVWNEKRAVGISVLDFEDTKDAINQSMIDGIYKNKSK